MIFSTRVPSNLTHNRLTEVELGLRARGVALVDLTETNPTRVGLAYPDGLLQPLGDPASLRYEPQPFGLPSAREAVAREYRGPGATVEPARVILTASTSEAYSFLFKLLCEPGDQVLVPVPSYPLFEYLTRLDLVDVRPYPLEYHGTWSVDLPALRSLVTPRTRAILVVSPNNPTGSVLGRADLDGLAGICAELDLALIGDEVFAEYLIDPRADMVRVLDQERALTFSLGGLSKSGGLPQVKLGWMIAGGPEALVDRALARLEIVCDAYLSVSTPVQQAAGALLAASRDVRQLIAARTIENLTTLTRLVLAYPACSLLRVEGGWSAVIRVPATQSEEQLVVDLLEHDHVLAHPGYFFDFPREAYVVVSLLPRPDEFGRGVRCLLARACP
ncbi:MAG TPA: pyridoxal phosphate-dependent aminotransferase [Vicinamibacterales bacterium]